MMMNFQEIAQLMKGRDPEQVVMSMIQNNKNIDPNISQMVAFAQTGDINSLVNLATSMFAKQGLNFNEEFQSFMSMMK